MYPINCYFFVHELVRPVAIYILCTVQCISGVIIRFQNFMLGKCIIDHKYIVYTVIIIHCRSALQWALVVIKFYVTKQFRLKSRVFFSGKSMMGIDFPAFLCGKLNPQLHNKEVYLSRTWKRNEKKIKKFKFVRLFK